MRVTAAMPARPRAPDEGAEAARSLEILSGEEAARARALARSIGRALASVPGYRLRHAGLASGTAGRALVFHHLHAVFPSEGFDAAAADAVRRTVELTEVDPYDAGLFAGLAGVGWAFQRLGAPDALLAPFDAAAREALAQSPWRGDYDLVNGLTGLGVYVLARPRAGLAGARRDLVRRLGERAEITGAGATWFRSPRFLKTEAAQRAAPFGFYDLGVAHGVPGVVGVLARLSDQDPKAAELLREATRWLLGHRLPAGGPAFPTRVGPWQPMGTRHAWCYGDPGVAAVLTAVDDPFVRSVGWEVALEAAGRRPLVDEPHLCHGTAGLAVTFHRLARRRGSEALGAAARAWYRETLALFAGLEGSLLEHPVVRAPEARPDHGLLEGLGGVALALLTGTGDLDDGWAGFLFPEADAEEIECTTRS